VANAIIVLLAGEDEDVVLTDRDGRFAIQIPPTKRELRVHKAGFEHLRLQPRNDETSLEVRLRCAAVLSGRVIDPRGDPVVNARYRSKRLQLRRVSPIAAARSRPALTSSLRQPIGTAGTARRGSCATWSPS
jgi:hypothetical protein